MLCWYLRLSDACCRPTRIACSAVPVPNRPSTKARHASKTLLPYRIHFGVVSRVEISAHSSFSHLAPIVIAPPRASLSRRGLQAAAPRKTASTCHQRNDPRRIIRKRERGMGRFDFFARRHKDHQKGQAPDMSGRIGLSTLYLLLGTYLRLYIH